MNMDIKQFFKLYDILNVTKDIYVAICIKSFF